MALLFWAVFLLCSGAYGLYVKWVYGECPYCYNRMTFGSSAVLIDLGPDVNDAGGEPDPCLEIFVGSDEYSCYFPELSGTAVGIWRCIDAFGNLEWAIDTRTDESRSSPAACDFFNVGDARPELIAGTTSGWNIEAIDRHGNFLWTFPSPPMTSGPFMWHSSPAVADVVPDVPGLEVVIGNNPCNSVWCLQADPSDGTDDGIHFDVHAASSCFTGYVASPAGTDGIDWDVLWVFETEGAVISTPALGDVDGDGDIDVVVGDGYWQTYLDFVSSTGGNVYCIDGPTGTLRWSVSTGGYLPVVDCSPALADFDGDGDLEVVFGANDGLLYFVDGDEDGDGSIAVSEMTAVVVGGEIHASPLVADVDADGAYEVVAASTNGQVLCVDYVPPTGASVEWTTTLDTAIVSSPAVANPFDPLCWTHFCGNPQRTNFYPAVGETLKVFVASMGGYLYQLDGASGAVEDSIKLGSHIHTSPVVADIDLDCRLEVVVTAVHKAFETIDSADAIYCIGTYLEDPECMTCGECVSWAKCPVDSVLPVVSCSTQAAVFVYAETTYWDFPFLPTTFASVHVRHADGSVLDFSVAGVSDRMNFSVGLGDTVEVAVWNYWQHLDSVTVVLDSIITAGGCTTRAFNVISFIVDLEPPVVEPLPGTPPSGDTLGAGWVSLDYTAFDSLAGVMEDISSVCVLIFHPGGGRDSLFFPGTLSAGFVCGEGDSVVVLVSVCDSVFDYGCSCPPNCTTYVFCYPVAGVGPVAEPVLPPEDAISACDDQQIWITITDSNGVDSQSVVVVIGGDTFRCVDEELSFRAETLFFEPPPGFWSDGETVWVELLAADDIYGNELQNPLSWRFFIDLAPPEASMEEPAESSYTYNLTQRITLELSDNLAGIWVDSSFVVVEGREYPLGELLGGISGDSLSATAVFDPQRWGLIWHPGDTVDVSVRLCDAPDLCAPNCATYSWVFFLPEPLGCQRIPNPFTPNADGKNDYCQFLAPMLGYEEAAIYIFDLHGALVREIDVPAGFSAKRVARWDGTDSSGRPVPPGLYLYVIEVGGEVVCEGTVTVAR